jgi:hypothetical protein
VRQLVTVLLAIIVFVWFLQMRRTPMRLMERRVCEHRYADARAAAETLEVDARPPMESQRPRAADSVALTCGALRKAGRL